MSHEIFEQAKPILKKIQNKGFKAYFVGGSVRDYIMQRPIHDVDITTSATPDEIESIFDKTIGKVLSITDIEDQVYYKLIQYNNPSSLSFFYKIQ